MKCVLFVGLCLFVLAPSRAQSVDSILVKLSYTSDMLMPASEDLAAMASNVYNQGMAVEERLLSDMADMAYLYGTTTNNLGALLSLYNRTPKARQDQQIVAYAVASIPRVDASMQRLHTQMTFSEHVLVHSAGERLLNTFKELDVIIHQLQDKFPLPKDEPLSPKK